MKTETKLINSIEDAQEILGNLFVVRKVTEEEVFFTSNSYEYEYKLPVESLERAFEKSANWLKPDYTSFEALCNILHEIAEFNKLANQNIIFVDLSYTKTTYKLTYYDPKTNQETTTVKTNFMRKLKILRNPENKTNKYFTFNVPNQDSVKVPQSAVNDKFITAMEKTGVSVEITNKNETVLDLMFEKAVIDYISKKGFNDSYDKFVEVVSKFKENEI